MSDSQNQITFPCIYHKTNHVGNKDNKRRRHLKIMARSNNDGEIVKTWPKDQDKSKSFASEYSESVPRILWMKCIYEWSYCFRMIIIFFYINFGTNWFLFMKHFMPINFFNTLSFVHIKKIMLNCFLNSLF